MVTRQNNWRCDVSFAYVLLRFALGLNICMHGAVRCADGPMHYARSLVTQFQQTPLPTWMVSGYGLMLPIMEAVIGFAVMLGIRTRQTLTAGALLMVSLTFGSTLRQDWQVAGLQLVYSLIYSILIAAVRFDDFGVNRLQQRRTSAGS